MGKSISSIKIKNVSYALCRLDEITTEILEIYRTGQIHHLQFNGLSKEPINEYNYNIDAAKINEFFDILVSKIKVQEWLDDYRVEVCDGKAWECKMHYIDSTIKKIEGNVVLPPRGEELQNYIYGLTSFAVKSRIL